MDYPIDSWEKQLTPKTQRKQSGPIVDVPKNATDYRWGFEVLPALNSRGKKPSQICFLVLAAHFWHTP